MIEAKSLHQKAIRVAAIEDVSDQIFDTIIPHEAPEPVPEIDRSRVRTRLLDINLFRRPSIGEGPAPSDETYCASCWQHGKTCDDFDETQPIFGRFVIVEGPGQGQSFPLSKDVTCIGRGADQDVALDFGDEYVSRAARVTPHMDRERDLVAVRFEDKRNPVLLDGKVLSGTQLLKQKSRLQIGQTMLRFVQIDNHETFWSV